MSEPIKSGSPDLVNRTRFSNALKNELLVALQQLSKDTNIPMSKLLDEAVELLLNQYKGTEG